MLPRGWGAVELFPTKAPSPRQPVCCRFTFDHYLVIFTAKLQKCKRILFAQHSACRNPKNIIKSIIGNRSDNHIIGCKYILVPLAKIFSARVPFKICTFSVLLLYLKVNSGLVAGFVHDNKCMLSCLLYLCSVLYAHTVKRDRCNTGRLIGTLDCNTLLVG